jgi:hypothetical protein
MKGRKRKAAAALPVADMLPVFTTRGGLTTELCRSSDMIDRSI